MRIESRTDEADRRTLERFADEARRLRKDWYIQTVACDRGSVYIELAQPINGAILNELHEFATRELRPLRRQILWCQPGVLPEPMGHSKPAKRGTWARHVHPGKRDL